jgi:histidine phosphotransfer protein HptB
MVTAAHLEMSTISMLQEVMEDAFVPLLESYLTDTQERLQELRDASAAHDAEQVRRVAHSLKGSSGNVGAMQMAELCLRVEEIGKLGSVDGVANIIGDIEQEFVQVEKAMQNYIH